MCCHKYESVYFCNSKCEQGSKQHQKICQSISDLQKQYRDKILRAGTYSTTLTLNENRAVASLVCERCLCELLPEGPPINSVIRLRSSSFHYKHRRTC